jgi:hypothetical protein
MKKKFSKILGIGLSIALVTSLLVAAVPAIALSQPVVTFGTPNVDNVISTPNAVHVITFSINKQLTGNATQRDSIVITFPTGYVIGGAVTGIISAGPGWVTDGNPPDPQWNPAAPTLGANFTSNPTLRTITYTMDNVPSYIGESAMVRIQINTGITNPGTPGDYTVTVATQKPGAIPIEAAVTSASYSIVTPYIFPLAGVVMAYNNAGILMGQSYSIITGIAQAGPGGRVELGPGTFNEAVNANVAGQTIIGTGGAGTVKIGMGGSLTISAGPVLPTGTTGVTIDNLTIEPPISGGPANMVTVTSGGGYAVIKNSTVKAGLTSAVTTANTTTISNTTIDTTRANAQTGIIATQKLTVTDSTINVGAGDTAIASSGGTAGPGASSVSGTTITGSSGKGIQTMAPGVITIDNTSLMSLSTALDIVSGTVTVKNSVIDTCGGATPGTGNAINVAAGTVTMYNNTIQNSAAANWAMNIVSGVVKAHFNNILNNTKNITTAVAANATHNWWGSVDGPAPLSTGGGPLLALIPYLGNSVTSASVAVGSPTLVAKTTVGMDVAVLTSTGTSGTAAVLAVSKYSANPELTAPTIMGTGKVVGYYDLYAAGVGSGQIVQVKFYVPVTNYTKIYYAGGISGRWVDAGGGVNTASGYAYLNIGGTASGLTVSDLGGTVFAVVEDKTATAGPSIASGIGAPLIGSYDVSTEPMFTWGTVAGSIRYEIALSEDPTFTIIEWSYNVDQTFYKVDEALRYDTTYYWRVRGVLGEPYQEAGQWKTPSTPWTVGIFTTASEPAPPPDPIVVQPTKPEVNVEIPPTKITIEPSQPAIPTYMLWIIVIVGAVLVIALIVLIVRTRRVV